MKKPIALIFSLSFLLTACFGGGGDSSTGESDEAFFFEYSTAQYSMDVPDKWETINAFTSEYPDNIRAAFRNNVKDSNLVANVNIIREASSKNTTNVDFSQKKLADHSENLVNYQLISQEEVSLEINGDESKTLLNTFSGKNSNSGNALEFMQTYLVKGDYAWTATATYLPNEDAFTIERMTTMLKTFTLQ